MGRITCCAVRSSLNARACRHHPHLLLHSPPHPLSPLDFLPCPLPHCSIFPLSTFICAHSSFVLGDRTLSSFYMFSYHSYISKKTKSSFAQCVTSQQHSSLFPLGSPTISYRLTLRASSPTSTFPPGSPTSPSPPQFRCISIR